MYKHILIPTDGSDLSSKAIQHGVALAKAVNAKVTAITVSTPFHVFAVDPALVTETPQSYAKRVADSSATYLSAAKNVASGSGVACDVIHVEHEHPYQAIIDTAKKNGCERI